MAVSGPYIAAAVLAAGSAQQQHMATKSQNSAQKKAAELDRASARIQQRSETRKLVANRRIKQANLSAQAFAENTGSNSAVTGAIGALSSDTASEIGLSNTKLAAGLGQSFALQRGASDAAKFGTVASTLGVFSSIASGFGDYKSRLSSQTKPLKSGTTPTPGTNGKYGNLTQEILPRSLRRNGKYGNLGG